MAGTVSMPQDRSFDNLMARLRTGDNDAAAQVFNRFANRLIELARRRLAPQIRQKLDPEDVLQSVFRSFFAHQAAGQITGLESWDNLWSWLVVITLRKCGRRIEYFYSASRDVHREIPAAPSDDKWDSDSGTSSDEPTPSEAAMLAETVEQLMNRLEGRHREILSLILQGYTVREISLQLGCTERMAYRVLERVKEMLEEMRIEADV
jgi:RNA polymerase sigma-70 factor, ECF subfamily